MRRISYASYVRQPAANFGMGIVVGALAGAVTYGVGRLVRHRREKAEKDRDRPSFIDGTHPPAPVELEARPTEEVNAIEVRLESEATDEPATSQRW